MMARRLIIDAPSDDALPAGLHDAGMTMEDAVAAKFTAMIETPNNLSQLSTNAQRGAIEVPDHAARAQLIEAIGEWQNAALTGLDGEPLRNETV
ncbi:hypothetical protein [Bradyrhizobium sp. HKCCYLS20291]|uniref:hypothetical protein n=1 Tax=Bradyrhizobium sp. HKCCYLS20291 TaxID=3420766 RepID=UPI003EB7FEB0